VIGEIAPLLGGRSSQVKAAGTYTDTLPLELQQRDPTGFVSYAVEVFNTHDRTAGTSNRVTVATAPTLPPVADLMAHVTDRGVVLTWLCPSLPTNTPSQLHYLLRIYRQREEDRKAAKLADLNLEDCSAGENRASFVDQTFEWEKNYHYRATITTIIAQVNTAVEVEGDDTPDVVVATHDVFPPSVPSELQAVETGGPQPFVDLTWTPVAEADLSGYNVFRHEPGGEPAKLNGEPVKTPAYRDSTVQAERTYLYSVSAVDLRGNESGRSEETSERVEP
jgi:hypothetical protein